MLSRTREAVILIRGILGVDLEEALNVPGMSWLVAVLAFPVMIINAIAATVIALVMFTVATVVTLGVFPLWWRGQRRRMIALERENEALSKALRTPSDRQKGT